MPATRDCVTMIQFICSTSARRIFLASKPFQLIILFSPPESRVWTRVVVNGSRGPGGLYNHTMTLVDSKLFIFGGTIAAGKYSNDMWVLDLDSCTFPSTLFEPF